MAGTGFAIYPASTMQIPKELQPITLVVAGSSPVSADLGFSFNGRVAQLGRARIFLHPLLQRVPLSGECGLVYRIEQRLMP